MKCINCNAELLDNTAFCPYCGTKSEYQQEQKVEVINETKKEEVETEASCWENFANISNTLGIVAISTFWIPILGLFAMLPGVPGIVFGALGKRSKKNGVSDIAQRGFTKSLVGTILSFVLFFVWYFIIIIAILNSAY